MLERWLAAVLLVGGLFVGAAFWSSASVPHEDPAVVEPPEATGPEPASEAAEPTRPAPKPAERHDDDRDDDDDDRDEDRKERKGKGKRGRGD